MGSAFPVPADVPEVTLSPAGGAGWQSGSSSALILSLLLVGFRGGCRRPQEAASCQQDEVLEGFIPEVLGWGLGMGSQDGVPRSGPLLLPMRPFSSWSASMNLYLLHRSPCEDLAIVIMPYQRI